MDPFLVLGVLVDVFIFIVFCLEIHKKRNSIDPDQMLRSAASEQGLCCLDPYAEEVF